MASDSNASGVATYAGANTVGISNLVALVALSAALAWMRSARSRRAIRLRRRTGCARAASSRSARRSPLLCYGLYALATRISKAQAGLRPGILLAALLMDLGLCSVSASSALLSLLLMGLLLRNAETRENVFQAQIKTGQDIGYALLFMMSAALVEVQQLFHWWTLLAALLLFGARIGLTRVALMPQRRLERAQEARDRAVAVFAGQFRLAGGRQFDGAHRGHGRAGGAASWPRCWH